MKLQSIDSEGLQREIQVPPSSSPELVRQIIRQLENAGFTDIKLVGERGEITAERFISLDEQRAAMSAIEAEQHYDPVCPDCGRVMEQDGGYPYCEHCDG